MTSRLYRLPFRPQEHKSLYFEECQGERGWGASCELEELIGREGAHWYTLKEAKRDVMAALIR